MLMLMLLIMGWLKCHATHGVGLRERHRSVMAAAADTDGAADDGRHAASLLAHDVVHVPLLLLLREITRISASASAGRHRRPHCRPLRRRRHAPIGR